MSKKENRPPLPLPAVRRFPVYLREIKAMSAGGLDFISGAVLSERTGTDHVLVRKDLALAGVAGRPRKGYPAKALAKAITKALGWDRPVQAALVGAGALGRSLMGYGGFAEQKLSIAVAFDADCPAGGTEIRGIPVLPAARMKVSVLRRGIRLAILTVPAAAAQACAEELAAAGVKGILNFTPVRLAVPPDVTVQDVDLAQSLAVLSRAITKDWI